MESLSHFSPRRFAGRVALIGALGLGAKAIDNGSFRTIETAKAGPAAAAATSTPDSGTIINNPYGLNNPTPTEVATHAAKKKAHATVTATLTPRAEAKPTQHAKATSTPTTEPTAQDPKTGDTGTDLGNDYYGKLPKTANLPAPVTTAPQNHWTQIPANKICLGDVKVQAGKIINTVYDSASQTALITETTSKAKTTIVKIYPPFGTVSCYPDSKANLQLLKTAAQTTADGKVDKRIIVDVIPEPSNQIQPRNRTFNWSTPSSDGSYQYNADQPFGLKKGFAVLGDVKQQDPKTGIEEPTYDNNANTAEIVIAATDGVVIENGNGAGWAVPADAKHLAQLKAQALISPVTTVDINYLTNQSVNVEAGAANQTATPTTENPVATATPAGVSEISNQGYPASSSVIAVPPHTLIEGDVTIPQFPIIAPKGDGNKMIVDDEDGVSFTAANGASRQTFNGPIPVSVQNGFINEGTQATDYYKISNGLVTEQVIPAGITTNQTATPTTENPIATATPAGIEVGQGINEPAGAVVPVAGCAIIVGDESIPNIPNVHPDSDSTTKEVMAVCNDNVTFTYAGFMQPLSGPADATGINKFAGQDSRPTQLFIANGPSAQSELIPSGGQFNPALLQTVS